ncbi:MAG: FAD-dependent oxidoreductase, partial [candidate division Zixibacteria bacterium]|nr:FAD-dependent oxidoreductase [candidate division Zixibacteria bacterium]
MTEFTYDLIVIGSGPAGQRAAIQASKLGKKIALIEMKNVVGGVCTNTGTIPSKTLREAVMHLSGYRERSIYGSAYAVKQSVTMEDLLFRTNQVTRHEIDIIKHQLSRNGVELISAKAALIDAHMVAAGSDTGEGQRILST